MSSRPNGPTISIADQRQQSWLSHSSHLHSKSYLHRDDTPSRSNTPSLLLQDATMVVPAAVHYDGDNEEDEHQRALFKELYLRSEAKIAGLFGGDISGVQDSGDTGAAQIEQAADEPNAVEQPKEQAPKKSARTIDEDNYDDDDEDD